MIPSIPDPSLAATTIVVAATFTAEPVEAALRFWMQELQIQANISFAPFGQLIQQLLVPSSLFSSNRQGINVLLVRLEDWAHESLASAVKAARERSSTPFLVCFCPSRPATETRARRVDEPVETGIASALAEVPDVYVVTSAELTAEYPVQDIFDAHADHLAHIPYTPAFFTALGTMIARKIYALRNTPYKVLAFDADQTLWSGVCGEEGPLAVTIDPSRQAIQEFLVRQLEAGRLLCLCSKNDEEDVAAVFDCRPEMILRRDQIVAWRVNWKPKSENLKSLARELHLGLESFIFLDDDPVACAEVQANCREVLALVLPQPPEAIAPFLQKIWAFDHLKVTKEGAGRTALYRQNQERRDFAMESLTLKDFLAGLGLKVQMAPLSSPNLARLAELTQRTNQFNVTTVRRSEAELQSLCRPEGPECLVVHVRDRFGDYGLVGAMIFGVASGALVVDTFLLSCRALGRGVEHRMLARLGEIAVQRGLPEVNVPFLPSPKNRPALDFLESVGSHSREVVNEGFLFRIPAPSAAALRYDPPVAEANRSSTDDRIVAATAGRASDTRAQAALLSSIATELSDVEQIQALIVAQTRARPDLIVPFAPPGTACETKLAAMFSELLGVEEVGINDNFFSLGGHSLLATMLISRLVDVFQVEVPITVLFEIDFTVAELARVVEKYQSRQAVPKDTTPENTTQVFAHLLETISDDDVRMLLAEQQQRSVPDQGGEEKA